MVGLVKFNDIISRLSYRDTDWFIKVLENVKKWQAEGYKITDVYLRHSGISAGILKNFFPLPVNVEITSKNIEDIAETLYKVRLYQLGIFTANEIEEKVAEDIKKNRQKSFSVMIEGVGVLRCTFSRSNLGHVLTVRLLDFSLPMLENVRLSGQYKVFLDSLLERVSVTVPGFGTPVATKRISRPGLIVHCGPTGSGKSTSIAAQLNYLSAESGGFIITYEDPIEYHFMDAYNVLQYEIGVHMEREGIYHHFLRSTAQVGLIGEVKTIEEIRQVVDLASRGHLIYTTLHAGSVAEALRILMEATKDNLNLLAGVLLGVISQRLKLEMGRRIVPVYEMLLLREDTAEASTLAMQLREQVRKGSEVEQFLGNMLPKLKNTGMYINQVENR